MKLKEMKLSDISSDKKYDYIFPIWATEQHWPFIPFGTDTYITEYIIEWIAAVYPEMVILPMLEYSRSQEHRWFYWTIRLTEETLLKVFEDVCNSIQAQARNIFMISFHANGAYINKFIQNYSSGDVNIIHLEICDEKDDAYIESKLLQWPVDCHAGNTEISNILVINETLVQVPKKDYPKSTIDDAFGTDNLIEKSSNWIVDNHEKWIVSKALGLEILNLYIQRVLKNINTTLLDWGKWMSNHIFFEVWRWFLSHSKGMHNKKLWTDLFSMQ